MPEKMSNEEVGQKISWEGGIYTTFCEYGLNPDNFEDEKLSEMVRKYVTAMEETDSIEFEIESYLKDYIEVM